MAMISGHDFFVEPEGLLIGGRRRLRGGLGHLGMIARAARRLRAQGMDAADFGRDPLHAWMLITETQIKNAIRNAPTSGKASFWGNMYELKLEPTGATITHLFNEDLPPLVLSLAEVAVSLETWPPPSRTNRYRGRFDDRDFALAQTRAGRKA
jgi:hypothetical protein